MLASDLFLPESWDQDRPRCRAAKIPDTVVHRTKWRIGIDQLESALGHGVRLDWVTFDEDYGNNTQFWFELDRLGLRAIGEVRSTFFVWATPPACRSGRAEHAAKRVDHLVTYSPAFRKQPWVRYQIKTTTAGLVEWEVKAAKVQLVQESGRNRNDGRSVPSSRRYWLIAARNAATGEIKYFVSNALDASLEEMLKAGWTRWHVEVWFERAKQEVGLGAFEMRNYPGLMRHWLICGMVMWFLTEQTNRLRGEKSGDHVRAGGTGSEPDCLAGLGPVAAEHRASGQDQLLLPTS
jgi:SRSO17 transposase